MRERNFPEVPPIVYGPSRPQRAEWPGEGPGHDEELTSCERGSRELRRDLEQRIDLELRRELKQRDEERLERHEGDGQDMRRRQGDEPPAAAGHEAAAAAPAPLGFRLYFRFILFMITF